jgi:hypothetical protein
MEALLWMSLFLFGSGDNPVPSEPKPFRLEIGKMYSYENLLACAYKQEADSITNTAKEFGTGIYRSNYLVNNNLCGYVSGLIVVDKVLDSFDDPQISLGKGRMRVVEFRLLRANETWIVLYGLITNPVVEPSEDA